MPAVRHATHESVPPLVDEFSHTLVLGTMLSVKSAEAAFYYAHPQNRFWRVLSSVFGVPFPETIKEKTFLARYYGIALWDVVESCDIIGSSDSTIKNVKFNDVVKLLSDYPNITRVFTTGKKAAELLKKYNSEHKNPIIEKAISLPSPSPLNCAVKLDALVEAYSVLKTKADVD